MRKVLALFFALISGIYLMVMGVTPDPLPIIDEATALLILVGSLRALGFDISRFLPFFGKKVPAEKAKSKDQGPVVDV